MSPSRSPHIVGFGGTPRPGSTSEQALRTALAAVEALGATTQVFTARELALPMYEPGMDGGPLAGSFIEAIRHADGIVIASPGYHGGVSGLVKNAIDWVEELRDDERPYFDGRAVGLIVCADGWQATTSTLVSLRSVVHSLRGWPTPLGVALNLAEPVFGVDGSVAPVAADQLELVGRQVVEHARARALTALSRRD